jgi:hypothetical protein
LPEPQVSVCHVKQGTLSIEWFIREEAPAMFLLTHYVIVLVGSEFTGVVKSDARYVNLFQKYNIFKVTEAVNLFFFN